MITDQANEALTGQLLRNLSQSAKSIVELSPVLLKSTGSTGFTGTGVIAYKNTEKGTFYVLTAKHNLLKAAKKAHDAIVRPAQWKPEDKDGNTATLVDYFRTNVRVEYRGADMTKETPETCSPSGAITAIKLMEDWTYDVCLLEVSYTPQVTPRVAVFGPSDREQLKDIAAAQRLFIDQLAIAINSRDQVDGLRKYQFLQVGFGVQDRAVKGDFIGSLDKCKTKASELQDAGAVRKVYDSDVGQYQDTFRLTSTENCTTYVGDSGGPLFCVELGATTAGIYLAGVTLGSDYFVRQEDEPPSLEEDPDGKYNNAATSLGQYYDRFNP